MKQTIFKILILVLVGAVIALSVFSEGDFAPPAEPPGGCIKGYCVPNPDIYQPPTFAMIQMCDQCSNLPADYCAGTPATVNGNQWDCRSEASGCKWIERCKKVG